MASEENYKVVLIGETKVGKTCIVNQYCNGNFDPNTPTSLTAQYIKKEIKIDESKSLILDIWDTAGLEKYRSLAKIFFRDSMAVILVYDPTDEKSFKELKEFWYSQVKDLNQVLAVVANKCDLEEKKIKDEEGKQFAESISAIFASVSAKDNIGLSDLFEQIGQAIKNKK